MYFSNELLWISVKNESLWKQNSPIDLTEEGIFISVNDEYDLNAKLSIFTKEHGSPNKIRFKDEQLSNAEQSISVTDEGIKICFSAKQQQKEKTFSLIIWIYDSMFTQLITPFGSNSYLIDLIPEMLIQTSILL